MTFDEYWNDPDRARASVGLYTHQIARAAYEAGARGAGAEVERLNKMLDDLRSTKTYKDLREELAVAREARDANYAAVLDLEEALAEAKAALQNERDRAGSCCDDANRYREELAEARAALENLRARVGELEGAQNEGAHGHERARGAQLRCGHCNEWCEPACPSCGHELLEHVPSTAAPVPPESVRAEEGNPPPAGTLLACGHVMGDLRCGD